MRLSLPCSLALLAGWLSIPSFASQWPGWRGPSATGSVPDGHPPVRWTPDEAAWKFALPGKGGSSPIVWNERTYLTTPADGEDAVLALDSRGKVLWQTKLGPESRARHTTLGSSCNASPATDGKAVFVYFRSGHFAALDLDGTVRWKSSLHEKFGPENLFWDQGSSPLLTDRHVILTRLHEGDSWIAAFDKDTGELRWKESRNFPTPKENNNGYTTPILFDHRGRPALLVWGADHLTAHDAADGKRLWTAGGFNPDATAYWPAIANPVVQGGTAFVPAGRDDRPGQARIHAIRLDGSGDVTATHRSWKREDIGVFVSALAEFRGRIYLLRHRGDVACLDPSTGRTLWAGSFPKSSASYFSSPVIANGILYAAREDGTVFSARVGEKFELLAENPMSERIVASPVPSGDRLLIRTDQHLFCLTAK